MAPQNKYNTQAAARSMEYAKTMNQINFEQQNEMFEKQAEWNSAEQQKQRLKEAGLNPALMYGIGGEGGSSVSSGGGSGAQVQGTGNPGTQAVMMGLQAKSIESQIALNNAQASKINAETEKTEKETIKERITSEINLTNAKAMESIANVKFTNENIKTRDAKIKDWASKVEFRSENVKLEKEKIENQVKQWIKEFGLEEEKFEKEKMTIS